MFCKDLPAITVEQRIRYQKLRDAAHGFGWSWLILAALSPLAGAMCGVGAAFCFFAWMILQGRAYAACDRLVDKCVAGAGHDEEEETHS